MDNSKVPSFGKSDKQLADAFGMSASDFKKVKKQIISDMKKPKATAKPTAKVKPTMPKSKGPATLTGEAAAEAVRKSTTPKGVKKFEKGARKALDKKYPGLYKKSK
jgi:hypothetical protein